MNLNNLIIDFENERDDLKAIPMQNYMRNKFKFLGVQATKRNELWKEYFKFAKKSKTVDWEFVNKCWDSEYREVQYLACHYLKIMKKFLLPTDIEKIKYIATKKSWWDTIDILDRVVGEIVFNYPESKSIMLEWSVCNNIWLRRIAIDHQLNRKQHTDINLLEEIIINNFGTDEFFINKAIGWSLREYSKTNKVWVKQFIEKYSNKMSNLSIREASKYL